MEKRDSNKQEDVFSKAVKAGKRTYFFDVKATRGNDYFLTITESKRRVDKNGKFCYDKHKVFLYKEDFEKFTDGLQEAFDFIRNEKGDDHGMEEIEYAAVAEVETPSVNGEAESSAPTASTHYISDISFDDLGGDDKF